MDGRRRHTNLAHQVMSDLGQQIARGDFSPGIALPAEDDLVAALGFSRTVIREAVKMLAAKGLVNTRPRRGTIVLPESHWNLADPDILDWLLHRKNVLPLILEFADVRLAIEPAAASLAARVANDEDISGLEQAIAGMRDASKGEADPLDADIAFHVAVLRASKNRFFYSLRFMIEVALRFSIRLSNSSKGVALASANDHATVLDAIVARDADGAEQAMRALILESKMLLGNARVADGAPEPLAVALSAP
jgi:DNA-binding FadR family transcriptional regulator